MAKRIWLIEIDIGNGTTHLGYIHSTTEPHEKDPVVLKIGATREIKGIIRMVRSPGHEWTLAFLDKPPDGT